MDLIAALSDLCKGAARPIIAIDGPAGAGKTTLAQQLFLAFSTSKSVQVIHMDDLYAGWDNALTNDLSKVLRQLIDHHLAMQAATIRRYNWSDATFGESETLPVVDLLILEGVGSADQQLQEHLTALIWMDIEPEDGLKRVINRDGQQVADQMKKWLTTQAEYFLQHSMREKADFILTT